MDTCPICKRKFPDHLITDAFISGRFVTMCPLCYAVGHLEIHGTKWQPREIIATDMFERAKRMYPEVTT